MRTVRPCFLILGFCLLSACASPGGGDPGGGDHGGEGGLQADGQPGGRGNSSLWTELARTAMQTGMGFLHH